MATRVSKALLELGAAMGQRPWILVYDPVDPSVRDHSGLQIALSLSHPPYFHQGLLVEGRKSLDEAIAARRTDARTSLLTTRPSDPRLDPTKSPARAPGDVPLVVQLSTDKAYWMVTKPWIHVAIDGSLLQATREDGPWEACVETPPPTKERPPS